MRKVLILLLLGLLALAPSPTYACKSPDCLPPSAQQGHHAKPDTRP
ncbi:MAG: hypothetical protein KGZ60_02900 [Truepera sp.]|nr:hypothetical protein [Truepera sp.]